MKKKSIEYKISLIIVITTIILIFVFYFINLGGLSLFRKKNEQYYFNTNEDLSSFLIKKKVENSAINDYSCNEIENDIIWISPNVTGHGFSNYLKYIYEFNDTSCFDLIVVEYYNEFDSFDYNYSIEDKSLITSSVILYSSNTDKIPEEDSWILKYSRVIYSWGKTFNEDESSLKPTSSSKKYVIIKYDEENTKEIRFSFIYFDNENNEDQSIKEDDFINDYMTYFKKVN